MMCRTTGNQLRSERQRKFLAFSYILCFSMIQAADCPSHDTTDGPTLQQRHAFEAS